MKTKAATGTRDKYAWHEVDRVDPPKRPAAWRVSDFEQGEAPYDQDTASAQASRCIECPNPSCAEACPLCIPIPELLALTAERRFDDAARLLLETHSLPEVFTQVCAGQHLCEAACVLGAKAEAIPIGSIARFLLHYSQEHHIPEPVADAPTGQRVAVIGAGLCGLVGADVLSRKGYGVTVLDCHAKPGGRVVNGLPGFRVDRQLVERRVQLLRERGVHFRMGVVCGKDVTLEELRSQFDAVFIGLGRAEPIPLTVPGAELQGVVDAYGFVLQNTAGVELTLATCDVRNRNVVVLGAGETAMDAARVAIRRGARKVSCVCRRDQGGIAANPDSFANAAEEGVQFYFETQALALRGNAEGQVTSVQCGRTVLGETDRSGRRTVDLLAGVEFELPAEVVLVAYGFAAPKLPKEGDFGLLAVDEQGRLRVDAEQMTNLAGVFAGGSIVRGPAVLATVVRDARNAVFAIDKHLTERRRQAVTIDGGGSKVPVR